MTIHARLNVWRAVVVGTVLADAVVAACGSIIAAVVATISLVAMFALLATTPRDAIVLPRARSERILIGGTLAMLCVAAVSTRPRVWIPVATLLSIVALLAIARRTQARAWWVALIAWNPVVYWIARG